MVSQKLVVPFGGPHNKGDSIWGAFIGVPILWENYHTGVLVRNIYNLDVYLAQGKLEKWFNF